jgi:DNA-binding NtrC family response regulator
MLIERVLIADDELLMREFLNEALAKLGCEATLASSGEEACRLIDKEPPYDLILSDIKMGGLDGLAVLTHARQRSSHSLVVLMTAHATLETALEAMRRGSFDYLIKPLLPNQLEILLKKAGEFKTLVEENRFYRQEAFRPEGWFEDLVGRSTPMKDVFRLVDKVATSSATVLLTGESGTGKELIARAIHQRSDRREKPFIRVNCAALPESLLESELFGHEKGAFTGAVDRRAGRFELAHTGTLLLDEISETNPMLQSKLLRVLQEREFERVGGTKTIKVDVRVICTSNRNLSKMVKEGSFREDLFYRLNVVPISLPPLRERGEDLFLLADYFLRRYSERHRRPLPILTPEARQALVDHPWPGNVRELENTIERTVLLCENTMLSSEALGLAGAAQSSAFLPVPQEAAPQGQLSAIEEAFDTNATNSLPEVEKRVILRTLKQTKGNLTEAARVLGISVRTLYTKVRE